MGDTCKISNSYNFIKKLKKEGNSALVCCDISMNEKKKIEKEKFLNTDIEWLKVTKPSPLSPSFFNNYNSKKSEKKTLGLQEQQNFCCSICLADYKVGDIIAYSENKECCHKFHKECIMQWLIMKKQNTKCPCCRRYYINLEQRNMLQSITTNKIKE